MKKHFGLIFLLLLLQHFLFAASSPIVLPIKKMKESGIVINHLPGNYDSSITLNISLQNGMQLVYSKDGNFPVNQSIACPGVLKIDTTTSLVFGIIRNSQLTDTFYCGTYLIGFKTVLPVTSLIIPPAELFDPEKGIYVGKLNEDGSTVGNCWNNIEKQAFFEYFNLNHDQKIGQYCGLKIFGGMTRQNSEKSMRVIARDIYGKDKFKANIFTTKEIHSFKSLILRISGNDFRGTRFLDMMCSSLAKDIGLDYMAYQPSVLFVNGSYWGIHNIREKVGKDYLKKNHQAHPDSTDLLQGNQSAIFGNNKKYKDLLHFLNVTKSNEPQFISGLQEKMDIMNYFNYMILQIHTTNLDSRGNIKFWRSSSVDDRFRWIYYDGDLSFSNPGLNFLEKKLSPEETDWYNPTWSTFLLRKVLSNQVLKSQFINQYCFLLATHLSNDTIQNRISFFEKWLRPEIPRHLKRRHFNQSVAAWESNVKRLRYFSEKRQTSSISHIKTVFDCGNTYHLSIHSPLPPNYVECKIAGNAWRHFPFSGLFFSNNKLTVSVNFVHPKYVFKQWSDGDKNTAKTIEDIEQDSFILEPQFEKVPKSPIYKHWEIKSVFFVENKNHPWILIKRNNKQFNIDSGIIHFPEIRQAVEVRFSNDLSSIIVAADTGYFRQTHQYFKGSLIEMKSLDFISNQIDLCLMDNKGDIIDCFEYASTMNSIKFQYVSRNEDNIKITANEPNLFQEIKLDSDNDKDYSILTYAMVTLIMTFVFIYYWRKKYFKSENLTNSDS